MLVLIKGGLLDWKLEVMPWSDRNVSSDLIGKHDVRVTEFRDFSSGRAIWHSFDWGCLNRLETVSSSEIAQPSLDLSARGRLREYICFAFLHEGTVSNNIFGLSRNFLLQNLNPSI